MLLNANPRRFHAKILLRRNECAPGSRGRLVVFNHFDQDGEVAAYVLRHLDALLAMGLSIVFVTTSKSLSAAAMRHLATRCWMVLRRPNRGLDLGGWPCAVRMIEATTGQPIDKCLTQLVMANDSVFGPLRPLWGITESVERDRHLQSYFIVFERRGLAFLQTWLKSFRFLMDREDLIGAYEIGLSQAGRLGGLRMGAWIPFERIQSMVEQEGTLLNQSVRDRFVQCKGALNPTHAFWRETVQQLASPYIKRDLIRDFGRFDDGRGTWQELLNHPLRLEVLTDIEQYLSDQALVRTRQF
jgi:hypothetical protein